MGSEPILPSKEYSFVSGRVQLNDLPSQAYFDVLKRWLANCETNHTRCRNDTPKLPKRVIYVAEEGESPYLVRGEGIHARYMALSHCWGHSKEGMTTTKNLEAHMHAIDWAALPKTFKDAIITCRRLGIKYIFIDRLCIVQDSESDWEELSALMGSIYHDSTVTLAASVGNDSSAGIFIPFRPSENFRIDVVALPPSFGDYKGQAFITVPPFVDDRRQIHRSTDQVGSNVLDSRAWVMQEMYLSQRTIHFLEREAIWCCCETEQVQNGQVRSAEYTLSVRNNLEFLARAFQNPWYLEDPEDDKDRETTICSKHSFVCDVNQADALEEHTRLVTSEPLHILAHVTQGGKTHHVLDLRAPLYRNPTPPTLIRASDDRAFYMFLIDIIQSSIHNLWYSMVDMYSSRQLTFPSDKLPAMAGIAARVQEITHDSYLAGHWRREMERSLFWEAFTNDLCGPPARAANYRAPSWSWASIDGRIISPSYNLARGGAIPPPIQIVDVSTRIDGNNPFGSVSDAKLVVKAHCVKAFWDAERAKFRLVGCFKTNSLGPVLGAATLYFSCLDSLDGTSAGWWCYDDRKYGVLPGPPLGRSPSEEELDSRLTCRFPMECTASYVSYRGLTKTPVPERFTYVPEELTIIKGCAWKVSLNSFVEVLVLAAVETGNGVFRRVGKGTLYSWDEEAESVEVLTIV